MKIQCHSLALAILVLLAGAPAQARDRERVLTTNLRDSQLSLRSHEASSLDDNDRLGMQMLMGWQEMGRSRFTLDTASDGGPLRFDSLTFEHKLPATQYQLLPGKLDLGLKLARENGSDWTYALSPKLQNQFGKFAVSAGLKAGVPQAGQPTGLYYRLASSYVLSPRLSIGLEGSGASGFGAAGTEAAAISSLTPQLSGRMHLGADATLSYGVGMGLAGDQTGPNLQLKLTIPVR